MNRFPPRTGAFTLVEVTLAIGIAAFSLLAVFGLLPLGINTNQAAVEQTGANDLLSAVASDLRSTPASVPKGTADVKSQQFGLTIPKNPVSAASAQPPVYVTIDGIPSTTLTPDSHYLLTVTFLSNNNYVSAASATARPPTLAQVKVTWPAAAGASNRTGTAEQFLVLDRN